MLEFWYSEKCNRQIKLVLCVLLCLVIYSCAKVAELSMAFSVMSLGLGALVHLLRQLKLKLQANGRYNSGFDALFSEQEVVYFDDVTKSETYQDAYFNIFIANATRLGADATSRRL